MNRSIYHQSAAIFQRVGSNPALVKNKLNEIILRAGGKLSYSFGGGRSLWPQELGLFLTYRCNLRCRMCALWRDQGYVSKGSSALLKEEVPADELLNRLQEIGPPRPKLNLAGGEIFLYEEWEKLIRGAKELGFPVAVVTNGTLLDRVAEKLVQLRVDDLCISVDGPREVHDRIRAAPGTFEKIERGVKEFHRVKALSGSPIPRLSISCVICRDNVPYLTEMIEVARHFQVDSFGFLHLQFITDEEYRGACNVMNSLFQCTPIEWSGFLTEEVDFPVEELIRQIEQLTESAERTPDFFSPELSSDQSRAYYRPGSKGANLTEERCRAPWHTAWILPNGDVSPCSSFIAGNLREEKFSRIWNNDRFYSFRKILRERGQFPQCKRCCGLRRWQ